MKAKELRIGNYIDSPHAGVEEVCDVLCDSVNTPSTEGIPLGEFDPIKLTEEWIERFGFERVGINYERGWLLLWRNKETGTVDFVLNEPHSNKRVIRHLEHVHQLQNLIFALTGEELTLTKAV